MLYFVVFTTKNIFSYCHVFYIIIFKLLIKKKINFNVLLCVKIILFLFTVYLCHLFLFLLIRVHFLFYFFYWTMIIDSIIWTDSYLDLWIIFFWDFKWQFQLDWCQSYIIILRLLFFFFFPLKIKNYVCLWYKTNFKFSFWYYNIRKILQIK